MLLSESGVSVPRPVEGGGLGADDPRASLAEGLSSHLTRGQISALIDSVLALEKEAWLNCPACKKRSKVSIPDAKAAVDSLGTLLVQGFGRPGERKQDTKIVVNRRIEYICEDGHPCASCAAEGKNSSVTFGGVAGGEDGPRAA